MSDNASKLTMFSCKLLPDAIFGGDTKSCASCDGTLVNILLLTNRLYRPFSSSVKSIRHGSVNSELIHRMNDSEEEFCV